jgi:hypothetical protein
MMPVFQRAKTVHALDRAVTVSGSIGLLPGGKERKKKKPTGLRSHAHDYKTQQLF